MHSKIGVLGLSMGATAAVLALYQAASAPKQYWVVPNAGHAQSFTIDPQGYMQRVDTFFDTYLR